MVENISDLINQNALRERIMRNSINYVHKFEYLNDFIKLINFMKNSVPEDKKAQIEVSLLNSYSWTKTKFLRNLKIIFQKINK